MAADTPIDWSSLRTLADTLSPEHRERVRDEWTRSAQVEHASIASFDRFCLQLLALGAPPLLLEQAHRAAIDEVRHAQLSFAVASIYAGQPLGPGPLVVSAQAFADFTPGFVLRSAVEEGCVGETLAAADAEAASTRVTDPALRQVLTTIANDEAEHAALAYRFVAWALGALGGEARHAIDAGFTTALSAIEATPVLEVIDDMWLEVHGRLSSATRTAQRNTALAEVILPARRELLGG